jgi:hypothetical protein
MARAHLRDGARRLLAVALAAVLAGAGAARAAAEEEAGRPGTVTLSSGEVLAGTLRLTRGKGLELFETTLRRRLTIRLEEVARLAALPEHEEMAQAWRFLEEGSPEKVKLAYRYPLRKILTEITLRSGASLRGHLVAAPLYVRAAEGERKVLLLADQKGEPDQALADLVYVREVALDGPAAPALGAASLAVLAPGAREIAAVDLAHEASLELAPGAPAPLVPGRYDIFVRTPKAIVFGLSGAPDALAPEDRAAIAARIAGIEEFFDGKEVRALAGGPGAARALVELTRARPSDGKDAAGKPYGYIRWELWTLAKSGASWDVTARLFLFRERVEPGAPLPRLEMRAAPACAGVEVAAGAGEVRVPTEEKP